MARISQTRVGKWKRRAALACVALIAWFLVAWAAAVGLIVEAELPRADAVAVLAGSSTYVERTRHAARIFREGRAPVVVLTNDNMRGGYDLARDSNPLFVERAADELLRAGVAPDHVEIVARPVSSTYEEAVVLREYAAERGMRSLLVVTSAYHSRRALRTLRRVFEGSGIEIGLAPVAPGEQAPRAYAWWLRPLGWKMVAGEYLKMVYYFFRYG